MIDNEITREKTFSEELPYFKERMKEVYDYYDNPKGCAEMLYIDAFSDSNRMVRKAEEEITRQQTEIEQLKFEIAKLLPEGCSYAIQVEVSNKLESQIKSEAVKEFAERLKEKSFKTIRNYGLTKDVVEVCDIDNLVKEIVDNEKGESEAMNKIFYLFIFADNSTYEMNCAVSFKDAVLEMAKNTGNSSDMFCKCLTAYKDDEIDEIIELFNHFCSYDYDEISKVYIIDRKIFDDKE